MSISFRLQFDQCIYHHETSSLSTLVSPRRVLLPFELSKFFSGLCSIARSCSFNFLDSQWLNSVTFSSK